MKKDNKIIAGHSLLFILFQLVALRNFCSFHFSIIFQAFHSTVKLTKNSGNLSEKTPLEEGTGNLGKGRRSKQQTTIFYFIYAKVQQLQLSFVANVSFFSLTESPPRDLQFNRIQSFLKKLSLKNKKYIFNIFFIEKKCSNFKINRLQKLNSLDNSRKFLMAVLGHHRAAHAAIEVHVSSETIGLRTLEFRPH